MSILIAYGTKYGFTKKCAEILAKKLNEKADICDLNVSNPNPAQYDIIIIGGSIYAGKIRKPVKRFCSENLDVLKSKKIGLFVCGLAEGDNALKQLKSVYPKELVSISIAKENFGGECNYNKMNFFERFIMKRITGSNKNQIKLDDKSIASFALQINNSKL